MTEDFKLIPRSGDVPEAADFSVTITDDCMQPYIMQGDTVYVSSRETLSEFDAGLFLYRDRILCRQWCEDYSGALHLLCANPARERENITVPAAERSACLCLGKIILSSKIPAPIYN